MEPNLDLLFVDELDEILPIDLIFGQQTPGIYKPYLMFLTE